MTYEINRMYIWRKFELGELSTVIRDVSKYFDVDPVNIDINAHYYTEEGNESKKLKINEIGGICELGKDPDSVVWGFHDKDHLWHSLSIKGSIDSLTVVLWMQTAEEAANIISLLEKKLNLEKFIEKELEEDKNEIIPSNYPNNITKEKEQRYLDNNENLRCFISYRFNPKSKALVLELTRFLELLNVDVITGLGYEPRKVSEKVLSRLENIDFAIYLITDEGESTWIRDELAVSIGKGYNIIPLVENNAKMENGILGDWEYVPYETNHIGDTFISLIEAINFIRKH